MKQNSKAWFLIFMLLSSTCWAYGGGGGGGKACAKPKFTDFIPAEHTEIAANAGFSFTASPNTYPTTIKVTIKDLPVTIQVNAENEGSFKVTGTLPPSLKNTYARIAISADGQSNCTGTGGWLVKIVGAGQ
ncbi:MAG: hypothetical protein PHH59_01710 [Methylovulum sp.]|uniref:hypothetical protein n=1 Tax=Methylovulum sp. TaxID=1916980 RepID=UPI002623407D|nr:hypothetical protein [Methylovulum sp.]MDD2722725.1 hypothetical protein [Methylovulum sp.]MDD5123977.1 hypothetical protein [Methylovulum sp.]